MEGNEGGVSRSSLLETRISYKKHDLDNLAEFRNPTEICYRYRKYVKFRGHV